MIFLKRNKKKKENVFVYSFVVALEIQKFWCSTRESFCLLHQQFEFISYRCFNHFRRKLASSNKAVNCFHRVLTSWKCREDLHLCEGQHLDLVTQNLLKIYTAIEGLVWANLMAFALSVAQPPAIAALRNWHFCRAMSHCLTLWYERTVTKWDGNVGVAKWLKSSKFTDFFFQSKQA